MKLDWGVMSNDYIRPGDLPGYTFAILWLIMSAALGPWINDAITGLATLEHRVDPYFRDPFNRLFQRPLTNFVQLLLRLTHRNPETRLCQEIPIAGEDGYTQTIIQLMGDFLKREYADRIAERAGNTKTYGVVSAEFEVLPDIPTSLRKGIFASARRFPAWIRFGGPGPLSPPDVKDAGILSIGIKLLGVPGEKLMPDETQTQDLSGISCPTFTTPNVVENVKLQRAIGARTPVFYFINPFDSHYLDMAMQGLYSRMNTSPLEVSYWSCVPSLLGEGTAMKYSVRPRSNARTRIPWNPPDNWLRQAMAATLSSQDVEMDFLVQVQTDPKRMPVEDASIEWPESLSPFLPVAKITIPRQTFDTTERDRLARELSFNPWHTIADHRPLGNLNRARRAIYLQLSQLRQSMNREPHIEPTAPHPGE